GREAGITKVLRSIFLLCWGTEESAGFVLKDCPGFFVILRYPSIFLPYSHRRVFLSLAICGPDAPEAGQRAPEAAGKIVGYCLLKNNVFLDARAVGSERRRG